MRGGGPDFQVFPKVEYMIRGLDFDDIMEEILATFGTHMADTRLKMS